MGAQKKLLDVILRNLGTVLKQFLVKVTARGQRTQSEKDVEYIAIEMVFIKTYVMQSKQYWRGEGNFAVLNAFELFKVA